MKGFAEKAKEEQSLTCRMPGCRNLWTVDVNHGRVCSFHDDSLSRSRGQRSPEKARPQEVVPFAQVARHWQDDDQEAA